MLLFTNFFYNALLTILILFIIASFIIYFLYKTKYYKKIFIWVFDKFFNEKNKKIWHINYRDFINDMKIFKFKEYFYICSITIISWVLYYYIFFILGKAIGIDYIPFWFMSITLTISSFLTLIPISISGIGARDGIFILLLSFYNIPIEKSIILSMLVLLIFVIIALWGLICWFKNPIKAKS